MENSVRLRVITYERYEYPLARAGEKNTVHTGNLLIFVYDIPYFDACGVFPPLHIANQIFSTGGGEGGMSPGTIWQPFTISNNEYDTLVDAVKRTPIAEIKPYARYALLPMKFDHAFDEIPERMRWFEAVCKKHRDNWHEGLRKAGVM